MRDVSSYPDSAWQRLGEEIRSRRVLLRLTQQQLADRARVSVNTIRNLEKGNRSRDLTLPGIDDALGWEDGSYRRILEGERPIIADVSVDAPLDDSLRLERPDDLSDEDWSVLSEKLHAEVEFFLRTRRRG